MAPRLAFSVDLDRCIGCQACAVACAAGNETGEHPGHTAISEVVEVRAGGLWGSFAHHRCFHCAEAPCTAVCPTGALSKQGGLTAVDPEKCSGCGYCTDACPFGVPVLRDGAVSKCTACLPLVESGGTPWCVQTCPSRALAFGERGEVVSAAHTRVAALRPRHPRAQVYGEEQLGGLGLVAVLLERPEVYGLPPRPALPASVSLWRDAVRPASSGLTALAAAAMGLAFVIARRRREREHSATPQEPGGPASGGGGGAP